MMLRFTAVVLALAGAATPALADRLDGGWCGGAGQQLHINGPEITLPSGKVMQGDYRRHSFTYVSPVGEQDAGATVHLQQLNDEQMQVLRSKDGAAPVAENWLRCDITS